MVKILTRFQNVNVQQLKKGDIVVAQIAFEENTTDYYHGHPVFDIISRATTDRFGNVSKSRPAIVMGTSENELFVAPLTTKNTSGHDSEHQMEIKYTKEVLEKSASFVEVTNMRRVPVQPYWSLPFIAELHPTDMSRLEERYHEEITRSVLDNPWKDTHTYVDDKQALLESLQSEGYEIIENGVQRERHQITFKGDIATSHRDMSLEATLKQHHRNAHFTTRSGAERKPCSPQIDLLLDDAKQMCQQTIKFQSTNHLPKGLDGKTTFARTHTQVLAANDHGAVSELGSLILRAHKIPQHVLPEFVTWYERENGLEIINPVPVKTDFSRLDLSPSLILPKNDSQDLQL